MDYKTEIEVLRPERWPATNDDLAAKLDRLEAKLNWPIALSETGAVRVELSDDTKVQLHRIEAKLGEPDAAQRSLVEVVRNAESHVINEFTDLNERLDRLEAKLNAALTCFEVLDQTCLNVGAVQVSLNEKLDALLRGEVQP